MMTKSISIYLGLNFFDFESFVMKEDTKKTVFFPARLVIINFYGIVQVNNVFERKW